MNKTLRQKIEVILNSINERIDLLDKSIIDYHNMGNVEAKNKCIIKRDSFKIVSDRLEEALKD